jgi:hypothetical protein
MDRDLAEDQMQLSIFIDFRQLNDAIYPWRSPVGARKEEKYTKGAECSLGDSALGE